MKNKDKLKMIISNYGTSFTLSTNHVKYAKMLFDFLVGGNVIANIIESENMKHGDSVHNRELLIKKKYTASLTFYYQNHGVIAINFYDNKTDRRVFFCSGSLCSKDPDSDPNVLTDIHYSNMELRFSMPIFEISTNVIKVGK